MLMGHYGAAYALRSQSPAIPLWVYFLLVQAVDLVFFLLALLDVETLKLLHGERGPLAMDLISIRFSHALVLNALVAFGIVLIGLLLKRGGAALLIAAAFASHWLFDLLVHEPDLPLTPAETNRVGFGLWELPLLGLGIELVVLLGGGLLLFRELHDPRAKFLVMWTLAGLSIAQILFVALPPIRPEWAFSLGAELFYLALAALAWRTDQTLNQPRPDPLPRWR